MSLQLILGSSGSGKSHQLYEEIISKSIQNEDVNYLVIVPEQFTLQTQKEIVTKHPNKGTMNTDILSFLRLAHRVFDEVGGNERPVLEDTGKSMILKKILLMKQDELIYFGRETKKIGFVSEFKSLISEMFQYSINDDDLKNIRESINDRPMLSNKLHDISLIYRSFKEYLEEKYITQEEILDVLCDMIPKSQLIKNSVISFDGFTGFTPAQYKLLGLLMKHAKKVLITVTIDDKEDIGGLGHEFQLFHFSKKTIQRLYEIATDNSIRIDKPIYPDKGPKAQVYRFINHPGLASLEKNIFRYPVKKYLKDQDEIRIHVSKDPKHEVSFVVGQTMSLVREEGYRYQDIAIITGDIGRYGSILEREFSRSNIPCFIDHKRELLNNPFVEMLRSMLDIIHKNFDYESVFRFLRSGLLDYKNDDLDILENYIIAFGIRGRTWWEREWDKTYKGQNEEELESINRIRKELVETLSPLASILLDQDKTVKDYTLAIYNQLIGFNTEEKLEEFREKFEQEGMLSIAKEYEQIYGIVIDLFEKLVDLLGDENIEITEYIEILEAGLKEAKVGVIPPGLDQILVGDIERTRLNNIKIVFFMGVNDGIIPKKASEGGVLSDLDREILSEHELELAPTRREEAYMEQFYLYLIMTKPTNKLYLSYSKLDSEGKTLRPSYLIGTMEKLFPKIKIIDEEAIREDLDKIISSDKGIGYLIRGLRNYPSEEVSIYWRELFSYYHKDENNKEILERLIKGAFYTNHERSLSANIARDLYGDKLLGSVTRFEQYARCPFAHYAKYGLNLRERVEYSLEAFDIGNLFHDALESFSKKVYQDGNDWENLSREVYEGWVDESVAEAAASPNNSIFSSSKRHEYVVNRAKRITNRTVWALKQQINKGDFIPSGFEVYFSGDNKLDSLNLDVSGRASIKLQGRIDRIDIFQNDKGQIMVRVVDYKSGKTSFDLLSVYHGLQLQLAIYLNASLELLQELYPEREIIPGAILYYTIDDPIVDKNSDVDATILKELKMDGIVNDNSEVIIHLDNDFIEDKQDKIDEEEGLDGNGSIKNLKSSVTSNIIPVKTNKDGSLSKMSKVVKREEMESLEKYVTDIVKDFGSKILSGDTSIEPYRLKKDTGCQYCPYASVCGFDLGIDGFYYRKLSELKDNDIWAEINTNIKEDIKTNIKEEDNKEGGEG